MRKVIVLSPTAQCSNSLRKAAGECDSAQYQQNNPLTLILSFVEFIWVQTERKMKLFFLLLFPKSETDSQMTEKVYVEFITAHVK